MDWINKQIITLTIDQLKRRWGAPKIMNERKIMNIPKIKYPAIYTGHKKRM